MKDFDVSYNGRPHQITPLVQPQKSQRPDWATRMPTVADVMKYKANDTIVASVVDAWTNGAFGTWEAAMVACVCYLAEDRKRLLDGAVQDAMKRPTSHIVG